MEAVSRVLLAHRLGQGGDGLPGDGRAAAQASMGEAFGVMHNLAFYDRHVRTPGLDTLAVVYAGRGFWWNQKQGNRIGFSAYLSSNSGSAQLSGIFLPW